MVILAFLRNHTTEDFMAWHEQGPSGNYFICLRVGSKRFRRSLGTQNKHDADADVARVEDNLRQVERGWLSIPATADVVSFLLSNGRVSAPLTIPDQLTLKVLFDRYFNALPTGSLEESTIYTMNVHRRSLEGHFGKSTLVESIDLVALQEYIDKRSRDPGLAGTLSPTTIRKEVVTLRTVWNWARHSKLVQGDFPTRGLKYPKGNEKPPYMPFQDILRRTRRMSPQLAAELWECAFLTREELSTLLAYVERLARHPFIYPMFVFCSHTGARRSEMARAQIDDLDFRSGFITIRERKKSRETKTTRRVPMSGLFKQAMRGWVKGRTGPLFSVDGEPFTPKALHHCFEYPLKASQWEHLRGWHVFRHSFISCLACRGIDQRIIDELVGHCTEQQRRRYRHLLPNKIKASVAAVFG
jgi:integrase